MPQHVLRQPRFYGITAALLILFGIIVEVGIFLQTPNFKVTNLLNPALIALLIGIPIMLSARNSIVLYDDSNLEYRNMFGKRTIIYWSENPKLHG